MGEYRTFVHDETGERVMTDPEFPEGKRMAAEGSGFSELDDTGRSGRIVETTDPEKANRIGFQNPEGNTQVSTADAAANRHPSDTAVASGLTDEDTDETDTKSAEDDELEGDEFDTFGDDKK